jgi:predicted metal-binding membrane protein
VSAAPSLAPVRRRPARNAVVLSAGLIAALLVAWFVTAQRMRGMDMGPGTDLGGLGWFVGVWVTMMAAMMFPSVAPMALAFARVSAARSRRSGGPVVAAWTFVGGYLLAWTAYGVVAYGLFRALRGLQPGFLAWDAQGPLVAGAAIAAAGAYQLTPLKRACLRHCRSPLHLVAGRWRGGRLGAVAMGVEHGAWCVGCCGGLMLVLFALGVMSLRWMVVVAAVIFAEKVLPFGHRLPRALAVAFLALGVWVAVAPGSVPGLTLPG